MKYLLMVVLLFSFNQARAVEAENFYSGNELLAMCEAYLSETGSAAKGNTCFGYVAGIVDAHNTFVNLADLEQSWCPPENLDGSQLVRVVTKYLQGNPQQLHLTASSLVVNALILAFPCE